MYAGAEYKDGPQNQWRNTVLIVLGKLVHFIEEKTESLSNTMKRNPRSLLSRTVATSDTWLFNLTMK